MPVSDTQKWPSAQIQTVFVQKIPYEQGGYNKSLIVLYMHDSNTMKIFSKCARKEESLDEANEAKYRASFDNITNHIRFNKFRLDQIDSSMFAVTYHLITNEVIRVTRLTDFNYNFADYFYENLDPKEWDYTNKR